jgi:hypothetical protein
MYYSLVLRVLEKNSRGLFHQRSDTRRNSTPGVSPGLTQFLRPLSVSSKCVTLQRSEVKPKIYAWSGVDVTQGVNQKQMVKVLLLRREKRRVLLKERVLRDKINPQEYLDDGDLISGYRFLRQLIIHLIFTVKQVHRSTDHSGGSKKGRI